MGSAQLGFGLSQVVLDAVDDPGVAGCLGLPASGSGVLAERGDAGGLLLECGDELDDGDEVGAAFTDVGVGAGLGYKVAARATELLLNEAADT